MDENLCSDENKNYMHQASRNWDSDGPNVPIATPTPAPTPDPPLETFIAPTPPPPSDLSAVEAVPYSYLQMVEKIKKIQAELERSSVIRNGANVSAGPNVPTPPTTPTISLA